MMEDKNLQELHQIFTEVCTAIAKKAKANPEEATASHLAVIRQFLKDNHIEGVPIPGSPLDELTKEYPFEQEVGQQSH